MQSNADQIQPFFLYYNPLNSLCYSEFQDVFDVVHFITSLRDEIEILEQVPHRLKKAVETRTFHSMPPVSWSNMSYYLNTVSSQ